MKSIVITAISIFILSGCGDSAEQKATANFSAQSSSQTSTPDNKNAQIIYLADGTGFTINGKAIKASIIENRRGRYQRYTLDLNGNAKNVEASIFDILKQNGYTQEVKPEKDGYLYYNYRKNRFPVVAARYLELKSGTLERDTVTRLTLIWKAGDKSQ